MRIEFSYLKNGEVKECSFTTPSRLNGRDKQYLQRFIVRMMINYIYDHEIERKDWVGGYIYDGDVCISEIDYVGNFIKKEDE